MYRENKIFMVARKGFKRIWRLENTPKESCSFFLIKNLRSQINLILYVDRIHRAKKSSQAIFPFNKDHLCFILYVYGTLLLSSEKKKRLRGLKDLGIYQGGLLLEKYAEFFVGGNVIAQRALTLLYTPCGWIIMY
jgi:hypothetical protein